MAGGARHVHRLTAPAIVAVLRERTVQLSQRCISEVQAVLPKHGHSVYHRPPDVHSTLRREPRAFRSGRNAEPPAGGASVPSDNIHQCSYTFSMKQTLLVK